MFYHCAHKVSPKLWQTTHHGLVGDLDTVYSHHPLWIDYCWSLRGRSIFQEYMIFIEGQTLSPLWRCHDIVNYWQIRILAYDLAKQASLLLDWKHFLLLITPFLTLVSCWESSALSSLLTYLYYILLIKNTWQIHAEQLWNKGLVCAKVSHYWSHNSVTFPKLKDY